MPLVPIKETQGAVLNVCRVAAILFASKEVGVFFYLCKFQVQRLFNSHSALLYTSIFWDDEGQT